MHPILGRTLGGLSGFYYCRQLFFGAVVAGLFTAALSSGPQPVGIGTWLFIAANTLLYPYARFAYEGAVGFIVGNNLFVLPAVLWLAIKVVTMVLCWAAALFIAPLGLAYLYLHHSRAERS